MGVLDARYKAEKVGYSFIGEKAKEDPNVIDYNINEEITKDTSAVFNANNDTTTGMANVIPGVNAPKLIAKTSIYGIDFNAGFQGGVQFRFYAASSTTVAPGEETYIMVDRMTEERNERGPYDFKYIQGKGMVMPSNGTYELTCLYDWSGSSGINTTFETLVGGEVVHTSSTMTTGGVTETFKINVYKGQGIMIREHLKNTDTVSKSVSYIVRVTISKL